MAPPRVVVIGAGLAGLTAARRLADAGCACTVVDKARGAGGRMTTRRLPLPDGREGRADHGAQFFTVRTPEFAREVDRWVGQGLATPWCEGFPGGAPPPAPGAGHTRYRGHPGMSAIPRHLAAGLDVRLGELVERIEPAGDQWTATCRSGLILAGDALLLTAPVPQALALLEASRVDLPAAHHRALAPLAYHPCLAVLAVLGGPARLPEPGALRLDRGPVEWLADNRRKGISPEGTVVTLHATPEFSRRHLDGDREAAADEMIAACADRLGAQVLTRQVHGWRYSRPVRCHPERSVLAVDRPPLVLAGDAFGEPRVEGAYLSGRAAARRLAERLGVQA